MHIGYVKIIKSVKIGGRQFTQGRGYEVDDQEARQLFRLGAAVPVTEGGRTLTTTRTAIDLKMRRLRG